MEPRYPVRCAKDCLYLAKRFLYLLRIVIAPICSPKIITPRKSPAVAALLNDILCALFHLSKAKKTTCRNMHDVKKSDAQIDVSAEQRRINKEKIARFKTLYRKCFKARDHSVVSLLPQLLDIQQNSVNEIAHHTEGILWIAPKAVAGFHPDYQHIAQAVTFGPDGLLDDPGILFDNFENNKNGTSFPTSIIVSAQKVSHNFLKAWRAAATNYFSADIAHPKTPLNLIRRGTSLDSIDKKAAEEYNIRVFNTPGINSPHVARFVTETLAIGDYIKLREEKKDIPTPKVVVFGAGAVGKAVITQMHEIYGLCPHVLTQTSLVRINERRTEIQSAIDMTLHNHYDLQPGSAVFPQSIEEALTDATHVAVCCSSSAGLIDVVAVQALLSGSHPIRLCCIARPEVFTVEAILLLPPSRVSLFFDYGPAILKPMQEKLASLSPSTDWIKWSSQAMSSESCKRDMDSAVLKIIFGNIVDNMMSNIAVYLESLRPLLEVNPDSYSFWNHRRILFLMQWNLRPQRILCDNEEAKRKHLNSILQGLLAEHEFNTIVLKKDYKSYAAWLHRRWIIHSLEQFDPVTTFPKVVQGERATVEKLLMADERNFHAWGYRRWVTGLLRHLGLYADDDEICFTEGKISSNFSNYSAWHNRAMLLQRWLREVCNGDGTIVGASAPQLPQMKEVNTFEAVGSVAQNIKTIKGINLTENKQRDASLKFVDPSAGGINMVSSDSSAASHDDEHTQRFVCRMLLKEGSMIRRAMYCDPGDQSAWLYAEWFALQLCTVTLSSQSPSPVRSVARRILYGLIAAAKELAEDDCVVCASSLMYPLWFIGSLCDNFSRLTKLRTSAIDAIVKNIALQAHEEDAVSSDIYDDDEYAGYNDEFSVEEEESGSHVCLPWPVVRSAVVGENSQTAKET